MQARQPLIRFILGHLNKGITNKELAASGEYEILAAASEAISKEMPLKTMENSPLRSLRSFMGMSTEEIRELMVKLQAAADNR